MNYFGLSVAAGNAVGAAAAVAYAVAGRRRDWVGALMLFLLARGVVIAGLVPFKGEALLNPILLTGIPTALAAAWFGLADCVASRVRFWRWAVVGAAVAFLTAGFALRSAVLMWQSLATYAAMVAVAATLAGRASDAVLMAVFFTGFASDAREYTILFGVNLGAHFPWYFLVNPHALGWVAALAAILTRGAVIRPEALALLRRAGWRAPLVALGVAGVVLGNLIPVARASCDPPAAGAVPAVASCALLSMPPHVRPAVAFFIRLAPFLLALPLVIHGNGNEAQVRRLQEGGGGRD